MLVALVVFTGIVSPDMGQAAQGPGGLSNPAARPLLWYLVGVLELEATTCTAADWTQSPGLLPRFFIPASFRPLKAMDFFMIE